MNGNPYQILGVRDGASEEEIKKAYKEQVKKWHPDRFQGDPREKMAGEKLRDINEAYDYLMKFGKAGTADGAYGRTASRASAEQSRAFRSEFDQIRQAIDANNLTMAEDMLSRIQIKNAEWIFLNGMICYKKGWYDEAVSNIQQAVNMEPGNVEYQQALDNLMNAGAGYRQQAYGRGYNNNDDAFCQALQCYCCADMCCPCF